MAEVSVAVMWLAFCVAQTIEDRGRRLRLMIGTLILMTAQLIAMWLR